jgi:hypothetical protein
VGVVAAVGSDVGVVVGLAGLVIEGSPCAVRGSGVVNERPGPKDTPVPAGAGIAHAGCVVRLRWAAP